MARSNLPFRTRFEFSHTSLDGLVSVPKTNPIPQLSIVVPLCGDTAAFESTLISVLENQPSSSEVIVPHDGTYEDPFDLGGEVRFVETNSDRFTDLVGIAAHHARGRFVHLLGDGLRATDGWTSSAVKAFDHFDTAAVVPVIRTHDGKRIIAAGWSNGLRRLGQPCPSLPAKQPSVTQNIGAYLPASFWRRDVLRSLHDAFDGIDVLETSMVYHYLLRKSGWKTELASDCFVSTDTETLVHDQQSFRRGMRLAAIRNHFSRFTGVQAAISAGIACAMSATRPSGLVEAFGQFWAPLAKGISNQIHLDAVLTCDEQGMIMPMPHSDGARRRRAA